MSGARLEIERLKLLLAKARREQYGQSSERGAKTHRPARAAAGRARGDRSRSRDRGRDRRTGGRPAGTTEQRPQTGPPALAGAPAARADRLPRALHLPQVRRPGAQARRGRHRDPRVRAAALEGGRARAGEGLLPPLRGDQPAAGALRTRSPVAVPVPTCWPWCWPPSTASTCRSPGRARSTPGEGVEIDVSTLADWVGAAAASLMPLVEAIRAHVFAAERIHADDTTVPVLAKEKTKIGRLWAYVRDDRPFAGPAPPAAAFFYSPDRGGEHPERHLASFAGIMQADAYAGFNRLYEPGRQPGPILEAGLLGACQAQALRARRGRQGADRGRGGAAHRPTVRDRARDHWPPGRGAPGGSRGALGADPGRARALAAAASSSGSHASRRSARRSPTRPSAGPRSPAS